MLSELDCVRFTVDDCEHIQLFVVEEFQFLQLLFVRFLRQVLASGLELR